MKRTSRLEETLEWQLSAARIYYQREVKFHDKRKWRFDFVLGIGRRIAVECEGITHYGPHLGRHQTQKGMEADCEKYNTALVLGWRVLRVTDKQIGSGQALQWIEQILKT